MSHTAASIAKAYYTAMGNKDLASLQGHLHEEVHFLSPLGELHGQDAVLASLKELITEFNTLTIRGAFGSEDQAMIALDLDCPAPVGRFRVAGLLSLEGQLIKEIELFYDGRSFEKEQERIFAEA